MEASAYQISVKASSFAVMVAKGRIAAATAAA